MSDIHVIVTGGTIDSDFDPAKATSAVRAESLIQTYIADKVKAYIDLSYDVLCMLDSKEITDSIRDQIIALIHASPHRRVMITHGTDTMAQTSEYISAHLGESDKIIILTGAMIPLKEFAMSDAGFNLGYALAALERSAPGVYVAMNGALFPAGEVVKNTEIGRFEGRV